MLTSLYHLMIIGFLFSLTPETVAKPPVFTPVFQENQIVFATVVATNAPYSADPTGTEDSTAAINAALDRVRQLGGGTCYLPAGFYRCDGRLLVPATVTFQGEWSRPEPGQPLAGTVLMAYPDRGNPDTNAFITVKAPKQGHVKDLAIWYPEQTADNIQPYPFTIQGIVSHIRRITLVNSYRGIHMQDNSGSVVSDIYGTALETGIWTQNSVEFGRLHNVRFSPDYWAGLGLPGGPAVEGATLQQFVSTNLTALHIGKSDGLAVFQVDARPAKTALKIAMTAEEEERMWTDPKMYGLGGLVWQVPGVRERRDWDSWYFGAHYADLDRIPSLPAIDFPFAPQRHPARIDAESIHVVTDTAYGARANGTADDAPAIQKALDAAGAAGGGTVYLPHGIYRVTQPLSVPEGVELRGVMATGQIRLWFEPCTLMVDWVPEEGADVFAAPAAITLAANAGVRGLTLSHSINIWETDESGQLVITPTSYAIRANGTNTWVQDVTLSNTYLGLDYGSARCDGFLVRDLWATALREGIRVGGGTQGGSLETVTVDFGPWHGWKRLPETAEKGVRSSYNEWIHNHLDLFIFDDCSDINAFSIAGFYPKRHVILSAAASGAAPQRLRFWTSLFDVSRDESICVEAGDQIDFYGLFSTGGDSGVYNWLEMDETFSGSLGVYGIQIQPKFFNKPFANPPAGFRLELEQSLATGKGVVAPSQPDPDHAAACAVDGSVFTWWESADRFDPVEKTLTVDLGTEYELDRWRVVGHGLVGHSLLNTWSAALLISSNGTDFVELDTFTDNMQPIVERPLPAGTQTRYVRLRVDEGTAPEEYGRARIHLFDVFGPDLQDAAP